MYTCFAAGNLEAMAPQLCPGLLGSLRARVGQRLPGTYVKWTLHKHITKPRLVSLRNSFIPGGEQTKQTRNGFMQAVVRIHSLQSTRTVKKVIVKENGMKVEREMTVDAQGKPATRDSLLPPKELVEYFVLQSVLRRSEMAPWKIWGTADEMTVKKFEKLELENNGKVVRVRSKV